MHRELASALSMSVGFKNGTVSCLRLVGVEGWLRVVDSLWDAQLRS